MNKRGQFFIIAAFVIISILFGLSAIYTTAETPSEDFFVYDLTKEIKYESGVVIDSGVFNALTKQEKDKNVENLTDYYASANLGTDFIIIFGNQTELTAIFYTTEDTGQIGLEFGGSHTGYNTTETRKYNTTFELTGGDDEVTVVIDEDVRYTFKVKPGEMFFIILKKERQGEQFVSASREE
jgi:hypothetical protein